MQDRSKDIEELNEIRRELLNDFFLFTRFFFQKKTGKEFIVSKPIANESHFIEIAREFTKVFNGDTQSLWLNCPPGWSKSELCKSFVCWSMARYPDCKFLYISYSHDLASSHTHSIRETMCLPIYKKLFAVDIKRDSSAKDFFQTTDGGAVAAFGSSGSITGRDAGLPGLSRFSGGIIIDDISKPDEIHSENIRNSIKKNYEETILMRLRSSNVPIIVIGQRLHEDDIFAYLGSGKDGRNWKKVVIKALDDAGNARYPEVLPLKQLLIKKELQPYVFASQFQQDPIPEGGGLFKKEWFPLLDEIPTILSTFITVDTAETDKNYNDATVFSFWGVYQVSMNGNLIDDLYALHWIDCREIRVEPKDLKDEFFDFWSSCMRFSVKPKFAAIEKKSTGVTLSSVLKEVQGLHIMDVPRSGASNNKTNRFIQMQQYIANKQITLPRFGKHTNRCLEHMSKITSNNVHAFDDICDTTYDAIRFALIDKIIINKEMNKMDYTDLSKNLMLNYNKVNRLKKSAYS